MDTARWSPTRPALIFCVDDNPDAADSTATLLQASGLNAVPYYGGRDALAAMNEASPDVCLLDLAMPGMDGVELAGRMRAWAAGRRRPLVIVAVTAHGDPESRAKTEAAGFDHHLVKPVRAAELLAITLALWNSADLPLQVTESESES